MHAFFNVAFRHVYCFLSRSKYGSTNQTHWHGENEKKNDM